MFEIYRYTDSDQSLWDDFVPNANNGTLFHLRSFLSYHPYDRFVDHSLLVNKKGKIFSVFPAAEQEIDGNRYLVSHPGSSVGSFVVNENLSIADSIDLVKSLISYSKRLKFDGIRITIPQTFISEDSQIIWTFPFEKQLQLLKKRDNKYFIFRKVFGIDNSKIQTISCEINQKAIEKGVKIRRSKDFQSFLIF